MSSIDVQGARVMIVDDAPAHLDVLRHGLEQHGYKVLVATSGEQALKIAQRTVPDLVLMDVMMSGMDGFAAL